MEIMHRGSSILEIVEESIREWKIVLEKLCKYSTKRQIANKKGKGSGGVRRQNV